MPDLIDNPPTMAYLGIGSNIEPREQTLREAIEALRLTPGIEVVRCSAIIETAPEGPIVDQPAFLNGVIEVRTTLLAATLLRTLLAIETAFGRSRAAERRWGPRTLDLDLLLYGDEVWNEAGFTVPHPRLAERRFVLDPLLELVPHGLHPALGVSFADLRERLELPSSGMPGR